MPDARDRHGIAAFSRAGSFQANADPATPRRARHIGNNKHPKGRRELEPWHVAGSTLATQLRRQRHLQSNTQRERPEQFWPGSPQRRVLQRGCGLHRNDPPVRC